MLFGLRCKERAHIAAVMIAKVLSTLHTGKLSTSGDIVVQDSQDHFVLAREERVRESENLTDENRVDVDDVVFHACIIPEGGAFVQRNQREIGSSQPSCFQRVTMA